MRKPEPELVEFLASEMAPYRCEPRKMFGCPVYFVKGNMWTGVYEEWVMLRLSPEDQETLFSEHDEAGPFEPLGRRMKEYVVLPESIVTDRDVWEKWLKRSYKYVSALSPKQKKKKKK